MTETSFKYHEGKSKSGANPLRPKFEFLHKVEEPKTEVQKIMDQKRAEKAEKEASKQSKQPANEV